MWGELGVGGDETISLPDMRQMYLTSAHHGRYVCASSIQRTIFANPKIALWTPRKIFKGETRHRGWLRPPSKLPLMRRSRGGTIECAGVFDTGLDVQAKNAVVRAVTTVGTMCIPHLRSRYLPARATGCLSGLRATDITFVQTYSSWRKSPSRHGHLVHPQLISKGIFLGWANILQVPPKGLSWNDPR